MQQSAKVPAPYRRLVQMVACAFYTGECPPYEGPPEGEKAPARKGTNVRSQRQASSRHPSRCHYTTAVSAALCASLFVVPSAWMCWELPQHGTLAGPHERFTAGPHAQAPFVGLGAVALDALARREWVKEDELAEQLKVHPKVLRRVLRYLEQARRAPPLPALHAPVSVGGALVACLTWTGQPRQLAWSLRQSSPRLVDGCRASCHLRSSCVGAEHACQPPPTSAASILSAQGCSLVYDARRSSWWRASTAGRRRRRGEAAPAPPPPPRRPPPSPAAAAAAWPARP